MKNFCEKKFFSYLKKEEKIKKETQKDKYKTHTTMNNLPAEIICYIGNYLGAEKIPFSLASKRLNEVLKYDVEKTKENLRKLNEELSYSFTFLLRNDKEATVTVRSKDILISKLKELHLPDEKYILSHMKKFLEVKPVIRITFDDRSFQFTHKTRKKIYKKLTYLIRKSLYNPLHQMHVETCLLELESMYYKTDLKGFEEFLDKIIYFIFSYLEKQKLN